MLQTIFARLKQGYRTMSYPEAPAVLPDRFRGRPDLFPEKCSTRSSCGLCRAVCPTGAILGEGKDLAIDLGRCVFCGECERVCPNQSVQFTNDHRLAVRRREDLIYRGGPLPVLTPLADDVRSLLSHSFKIRQVSASGCNACEADINVLGTLAFDWGRFGISVVASPRHADALLVTGPVSQQMKLALQKTFDATPTPRVVVAVGVCAISGGPFVDHPEVTNGAATTLPVDLFIPGCPPHPMTILDGVLRFLGRIP